MLISVQGVFLKRTVGQVPTVLAVGAGELLGYFSLTYHFSFLSPFLWETARYSTEILKEPINSKQPTNLAI